MPDRSILHVDMDAFFASIEQRERPEFSGRPVVVGADPKGGRGRGVVAACSYEARRFGIHSAQPITQAYRLCPHAVFLRPKGALYSAVSSQIMAILGRFTDLVEPISIDEAFLDASGSQRLFGGPVEIALAIKEAIRKEQSLTCSIGIAPNKFLAKIASDINKPDGLTRVEAGSEKAFLRDLPVRAIWGVGPKTEQRLLQMGIRTIGNVADRPLTYWASQWGRHGEHLWRLSQGIDDRPVHRHSGFKSLSHENTFMEDTDDLDKIRQTLLRLSEDVAARARRHTAVGRTVHLKWRYSDFTTLTRQASLNHPTNDAQRIYGLACRLMEKLLPLSRKIRLVGVGLSHFEEEKRQPGLFDAPSARKRKLDASLDEIASKFGKGVVKKASLLDDAHDEDDSFSSFLKR